MKPIYLDYQSTTPTNRDVVKTMMPYFSDVYGNPHSSNHKYGIKASDAIENGRKKIAKAIGSDPEEIIFTSGATESNNLAIKGSFLYRFKNHNRKKIIIASTEHKCVLEASNSLTSIGAEVIIIKVNDKGEVNLRQLKDKIDGEVALVSIMLANNEIGVIQPIDLINSIAKSKGVLMMSDATQSVGKMKIDLDELNIDILCFSGHKVYAPKGIGCLYINNNIDFLDFKIHIDKIKNKGTLNVPGIVAIGKAIEIANLEMNNNENKISRLRDYLESELLKIDGTSVNGDTTQRLYNTSNICFKGQLANVIIGRLGSVAVSNGSACQSRVEEASHVLKAMGLSNEDALASIRFSLGIYNSIEEIDTTIEKIKTLINTSVNYA